MAFHRVEIRLQRSIDDPPENAPEYQAELQEINTAFHAEGIAFNQTAIAFDSADALGYPLGEFLITLTQGALPVVSGVVGAWIQARYGRKVRIKSGEIEVEAATVEEVEKLLETIKTLEDKGDAR